VQNPTVLPMIGFLHTASTHHATFDAPLDDSVPTTTKSKR
jgi:hypothetical protein